VNKELMAVKAELQRKIDELEKANSETADKMTDRQVAAKVRKRFPK